MGLLVVAIIISFGVVSNSTNAQAYIAHKSQLKIGSRGAAVTKLQIILTSEKIYSGPISGYYGRLTADAVKVFQAKYGLEIVGSVGPLTRAILNSLVATAATQKPTEKLILATSSTSSAPSASQQIQSTLVSTSAKVPTTTPIKPVVLVKAVAAPVVPIPPKVTSIVATSAPVVSRLQGGALQWGVFPGNDTLANVESKVEKQANIQAVFTGFGDPFPAYLGTICSSNSSKTLLVFWENYGYSLDNIIAGNYDSYIQSFANQTAQYPCPVIISLFHEMNGNWDDWDGTMPGNSPAKIIAAWKHIHNLFSAYPVLNVTWAWAVNNTSVPDVTGNQPSDYYPGDAYVDYVGVDGFNFANPWQTFGEVFDTAITKLQTYHKPIYIFSMGSTAGSSKAAWITEGLGTHIKTYPNVKGWVWFNMNDRGTNWLIDSDPASLSAFKSVLP